MSVQTENRAGQEVGKGSMDPLFDAEAQHQPGMAPVVSPEGREGELIGSATGKVRGKRIRGTIRVTFYSAECVFPKYSRVSRLTPGSTSAKRIRAGSSRRTTAPSSKSTARGSACEGSIQGNPKDGGS